MIRISFINKFSCIIKNVNRKDDLVMKMEYKVKIDAFEGPLDLLLHLINRLEIDIYDIPMAEITEQYLIFIHAMKELELDVASEYLVMAATLLAIKSKMLLPHHDDNVDDELFEEHDPRVELVEQLMEYKKYKEAAVALKEKEHERGEIFMKQPSDLSEFVDQTEKSLTPLGVTIYDMLGAYHKMLRRKKLQRPLNTKITHKEISIEDRMSELLLDLTRFKRKSFFSCFEKQNKAQIVVTFLAMLELMKRQEIAVEQEDNFSEIYLTIER